METRLLLVKQSDFFVNISPNSRYVCNFSCVNSTLFIVVIGKRPNSSKISKKCVYYGDNSK